MEKFTRVMRGYDPDEVNNFLDQVIKRVEKMIADIDAKNKLIVDKNDEIRKLKLKLEAAGFPFTATFQVKDNYVHRKVAGNDVLIAIGEDVANFNGYIQMNPSAAYLWEAMKEPRTVAQLEKTLEDAFDVSCVQATADVLDFLKVLQEHNMICAQ